MALILLLLLAVLPASQAIDNGLALTPGMGYNTWNDFRCADISAVNVMKVADAMVAGGFLAAGYRYLNIDDCWSTSRDSSNTLVPDPVAFPNGMKPVVDYVHSKGLLIGIYTDRGNLTCQKRPGSLGFEAKDATTFAEWGIDYLKEDSCFATDDHDQAFQEYGLMMKALNATGRPIYFSLCGWNSWYAPVGRTLGNSWRIAGDCNAWDTIYNAIRVNENLAQYAGPGAWNDPDMLVGSTTTAASHNLPHQARAQFSLWAVMAAPLLIGSSMLNMSDFDRETYTNTEVIDIDQDSLGKQGAPVVNTCPPHDQVHFERIMRHGTSFIPPCYQIWARPLANGDVALAFINFKPLKTTVECDAKCMQSVGKTSAKFRDVWAHSDLGRFSTFSVTLQGMGGSALYRLSS